MSENESEINVSASDALDFEPVSIKPSKFAQRLKGTFFLLLSSAVGAMGWEYFGDRVLVSFGYQDTEVPVIRSELGEVKRRPESPGGMTVPNQETFVYDSIHKSAGGKTRQPPVERLLPPPEKPLPKIFEDKVALVQNKQTFNLKKLSRTPSRVDIEEAKKPQSPPLVPKTDKIEIKPTSPREVLSENNSNPPQAQSYGKAGQLDKPLKTSSQKKPPFRAVQLKKGQKDLTPKKVYKVQLAASRTIRATRKVWSNLRKQNLDLLSNFDMNVTKVDLGKSKGIFYRLRIGPFLGRKEARSLCKALKKRKIGCLVIRPGK